MATSVLSLAKRYASKALVGAGLLASTMATAQTGNPIPGYAYLGSCTVGGQPHYYYVSRTEATWPVANAAATALGGGTGYLATLTSQAENDCVFNLYANYLTNGVPAYPVPLGRPTFTDSYRDPRNPWIGLTDQASENTFLWANGENCSEFRNWDCGDGVNLSPADGDNCEPNDQFIPASSNGEDYVQLLAFLPGANEPVVNTPQGPGDAAPGGLGRKHAGYWNDWFNIESQYYIVEFGPSTCLGNEGCTPGYWKNHTNAWPATYLPGTPISTYFTIPNCLPGFGSRTLLQSLQGGGGPGITGAATVLLRAAVAGLLNAAHPSVDYPLAPPQIQAQVNAALASCNRNTMLALATTIDGYNNLGCPINAHNDGTTRNPVSINGLSLDKAFAVSGYPNPSRSNFNIQIDGASTENVTIRVTDMSGRLVEQRSNVAPNRVVSLGANYRAGMYYIEVAQGSMKKQLKMVKQ